MFEGEMASLESIQKTNIVRVPQPIKVIDLPGGGAMFVMEYLKMKHLNKYVFTSCSLCCVFGIFFLHLVRNLPKKDLIILRDTVCYLLRSIFLCTYTYFISLYIYNYIYIYFIYTYT